MIGEVEAATTGRDAVIPFEGTVRRLPAKMDVHALERSGDLLTEVFARRSRQLYGFRTLVQPGDPTPHGLPRLLIAGWSAGMGGLRQLYLSDTRPNDDGARSTLCDAVVRRQQHAVRKRVVADRAVVGLVEEELKLVRLRKAGDVLDDEDLRT